MTYLRKKYINEAIRQNLRKKDVYKSDMHKIYNLVVRQMNEQLQEKVASDATFQLVKTDRDPIDYLMILKKCMLLKPVWAATNPLVMPVYKSSI